MFECGVHESTRRATPSFLLVGLGLLERLAASGEGPASRALLELGLVIVELVMLVIGFIQFASSRLVCLEMGNCLRLSNSCDADFESFVFKC
jgi:hypothetical protein